MAKIFDPPEGFNPPDIRSYVGSRSYKDNINDYFKACENYVKSIKKFARDAHRDVCPEAGEEIRFPVGDGYAQYIVARLKPVELIHVDSGDDWHFQYAHRLTASDVREEIRHNKAMNNLFRNAKKRSH